MLTRNLVLYFDSEIEYNNTMKYLLAVLFLTGCSTTQLTFIEMKDVQIDNSASNNFIGNPCKFYVNDYCVLMNKPTNPNNPYDRRRSD